MRLTALQQEHLHELSVALARPTADTDALVSRGLAERGRGKFGEWARITAAGRAELDSRMTRDRGHKATPTVSPCSEKTGSQFMPAAAACPPHARTATESPRSDSQSPAPTTTASRTPENRSSGRSWSGAVVPHADSTPSSTARKPSASGHERGNRGAESAPTGGKTLRIYQVHYIDDKGRSLGYSWHRSEREARSAAHARRSSGPIVSSHDISTNKDGIIDALTRFASHPR